MKKVRRLYIGAPSPRQHVDCILVPPRPANMWVVYWCPLAPPTCGLYIGAPLAPPTCGLYIGAPRRPTNMCGPIGPCGTTAIHSPLSVTNETYRFSQGEPASCLVLVAVGGCGFNCKYLSNLLFPVLLFPHHGNGVKVSVSSFLLLEQIQLWRPVSASVSCSHGSEAIEGAMWCQCDCTCDRNCTTVTNRRNYLAEHWEQSDHMTLINAPKYTNYT